MNSTILFILLQFNLFGSSGEALQGSTVTIANATSNTPVAFMLIGQTGNFEFANLDPGNYKLILNVPQNTVKSVDRRTRHKFESDIEAGYNPGKTAFFWQHPDGFVKVDFKRKSRIADAIIPKFDYPEETKEAVDDEDGGFFGRLTSKNEEDKIPEEVTILHFTVVRSGGRISGEVESSSQRDFFKMMVGNDNEKYEDSGKVIVLSRFE